MGRVWRKGRGGLRLGGSQPRVINTSLGPESTKHQVPRTWQSHLRAWSWAGCRGAAGCAETMVPQVQEWHAPGHWAHHGPSTQLYGSHGTRWWSVSCCNGSLGEGSRGDHMSGDSAAAWLWPLGTPVLLLSFLCGSHCPLLLPKQRCSFGPDLTHILLACGREQGLLWVERGSQPSWLLMWG